MFDGIFENSRGWMKRGAFDEDGHVNLTTMFTDVNEKDKEKSLRRSDKPRKAGMEVFSV